ALAPEMSQGPSAPMPMLPFKVRHLKRYQEISRLLRYVRPDLWQGEGEEAELLAGDAAPGRLDDADRLAAELEALGPTFIKLGQLLSTRADLLPMPYLTALSRLQDKIEPFPFEEVEQIVSTELSVRLSKAFSEFDRTPLAAA